MKPTANLMIGFFYKICFNSSLNRYLNRCLNHRLRHHAYRAQHQLSTMAQRENEACTARIMHQGVMQIRLRLHSHSHSHSL